MARLQRHVQPSSGTVSSSPLTRRASLRVEVWTLAVEAVRRINKYIKGEVEHGWRSLHQALVTGAPLQAKDLLSFHGNR